MSFAGIAMIVAVGPIGASGVKPSDICPCGRGESDGSGQIRLREVSVHKVGIRKQRTVKSRLDEVDIGEIGLREVRLGQIGAPEVCLCQVTSMKIYHLETATAAI